MTIGRTNALMAAYRQGRPVRPRVKPSGEPPRRDYTHGYPGYIPGLGEVPRTKIAIHKAQQAARHDRSYNPRNAYGPPKSNAPYGGRDDDNMRKLRRRPTRPYRHNTQVN